MTIALVALAGVGSLFIGDRQSADEPRELSSWKIDVVINMTDRSPDDRKRQTISPKRDPKIRYHRFPIEDGTIYPYERSKFMAIVRRAMRTGRNALDRGDNVLIHCRLGINRSALTIGLLLIEMYGWSLGEVLVCLQRANEERQVDLLTNTDFREMLTASHNQQTTVSRRD